MSALTITDDLPCVELSEGDLILGKGGYGSVRLASPTSVVKIVTSDYGDCGRFDYNSGLAEVDLTIALQHCRQVVALQRLLVFKVKDRTGTDHIAMELERGVSFGSWISDHQFSKTRAENLARYRQGKRFFLEVLYGLCYLDIAGVLHRDMKIDNLIITRCQKEHTGWTAECCRPALKIIDFGLAVFASNVKHNPRVTLPVYRAPECYAHLPHGCPIDIWAAGVMLREIILGDVLFEVDNPDDLSQGIKSLLSTAVDENATEIVRQFFGEAYLTHYRPTSQPTEKAFYEYYDLPVEEYQRFLEVFRGCLTFDPKLRKKAIELINMDWFDDVRDSKLSIIPSIDHQERPYRILDSESRRTLLRKLTATINKLASDAQTRTATRGHLNLRVVTHGISVFDRILVNAYRPTPAIGAETTLYLCIYMAAKYFNDLGRAFPFSALHQTRASYEELAQLEWEIFHKYLDNCFYTPTVYEASTRPDGTLDFAKYMHAIQAIIWGTTEMKTPSQLVS